jgi:hypothetical protein
MIDTVKLTVPYEERPEWLDRVRRDTGYVAGSGVFTATIKPSKSYKQKGLYLPQLQYVERPPTKDRAKTRTLNIELSLPKLLFGNNFDELTDELFSAVVNELSKRIWVVYDVKISPADIKQATVARIDYSKNIVFTDRTPVSTIVGVIAMGNIPKTYDVQKIDFRNGGLIYHIHANIMDIVMYDKVADLRQAKVSEKRSHEKYNYTQLKLIDEFEKRKNVTVARFEIRLSTKRKIRNELKAIDESDDLRFCHVFSTAISRKILLRHWENITNQISKNELLADTTTQMLVSHVNTKTDMQFAEASALTLMQLIRKEVNEERAVRNIIEGLFSKGQYTRLKKIGRNQPTKTQLTSLLHITKTLTEMKPVSVTDFIK